MKPGRNDPCPCGSGKKYKQCCLRAAAGSPAQAEDLVWRRQRRLNDEFQRDILRFIERSYGRSSMREALVEFMQEEFDEPIDQEWPYMPVFAPWYYHRWAPDAGNTAVADPELHGMPPTVAYLNARGGRLDPQLREYLESCLLAPFSFYEVLHADPGHGLRLRDVLLGEEHTVLERSASATLRRGDILYAQLARAGGRAFLEACSPVALPPIDTVELLALRDELRSESGQFGPDELRAFEAELREYYLDRADALLYPQMPSIMNSDDEWLALQTLRFEIDSPAAAYDALKHVALAAGRTESELLQEATYDAQGTLASIHLPWLRSSPAQPVSADEGGETTILGFIEIEGNRLEISVNSHERAALARALVDSELGSRARYQVSVVSSLERMFEDGLDAQAVVSAPQATVEEVPPEVEARLNELRERQYQRWVDESLPVLGGMTPQEALATPTGRAQVAALLDQFERDRELETPPADPGILRRLRERLGLDR